MLLQCENEFINNRRKIITKTRIVHFIDPKKINFCQISINRYFDTPDGKISIFLSKRLGANQVQQFPPIGVINIKGQLIVRDGNSRLYIARITRSRVIKYVIETDWQNINNVFSRLRANGLPNEGTNDLPTPR